MLCRVEHVEVWCHAAEPAAVTLTHDAADHMVPGLGQCFELCWSRVTVLKAWAWLICLIDCGCDVRALAGAGSRVHTGYGV
jgi:hypothetical protein